MTTYKAPKPLKFSAKQDAQHRVHEARIDYVVEHRGEFLQLVALASKQSLQETVEETGFGASVSGRSFDEFLYERWQALYHPNAAHMNFSVRPINFEAYQSVMASAARA
jgi:hypothetical protein